MKTIKKTNLRLHIEQFKRNDKILQRFCFFISHVQTLCSNFYHKLIVKQSAHCSS